ncbi:endoplasmin homolog [Scaptodrosophila lebanonensis]|uniref:Heat shock protein 83 n=1 Tax=Drosophila lebanonensis TaxID=7225 RepID=A0A6J2T7I1_DROLE|nr:endoplasmin homolog [Scaptodrosophila lebanonensis]
MKYFLLLGVLLLAGINQIAANTDGGDEKPETIDLNIGSFKEGSRTDAETLKREEEAIKLDGLNIAQLKELREKAEKFTFQTEVNRMMKLIINSLYRNKEIFLRELISNASDAIDKIRLLALTNRKELESNPDLHIRIKADKENKVLHIMDSGIGMTHQDLINNLGTIAKSGTADFLAKMQDPSKAEGQDLNDMIGQFGVGFYSAFLVADRVVVTTKHNDDKQYIWESDANSFSITEDPRGNTLNRGSIISLYLKDEAQDFLEQDTVRELIRKYSQFINFPILMWSSKTVDEEVPIEEEASKPEKSEDNTEDADEDAKVEEDTEEDKPKTKKVSKTTWDWQLINDSKPIWTRKPADVTADEYTEFYKSLTKDSSEPLTQTHFVAEGEVTFKSLLYIPKVQPSESFNRYGTKSDNIKLYVRRVFITDEFNDMMPNYLNFIRGVVDSDDLPLNVSRETLQQHKLIKVIKKKLVRKVLDMIKKIDKEAYEKFWKEFSTNIKLGIMEDPSNRSRLAKLLRFQTSNGKGVTSLAEYVERMKSKQDHIYYIAGANRAEVEKSPFVERLLSKGYEVLYLVEAVDEYCISALPEFDGKKFQNVAKEGFKLNESAKSKEKFENLKNAFEPLVKWLNDVALKDQISKAQVSERLSNSPCALVAGVFGWTGNMERLAMSNAHQKADDPQRSYYLNQKKTLEINPRHPLMRELLRRVESDEADENAKNMALMMFRTATLRSGYMLQETANFADSIEQMMRQTLGLSLDEQVELDEDDDEADADDAKSSEDSGASNADEDEEDTQHDEL